MNRESVDEVWLRVPRPQPGRQLNGLPVPSDRDVRAWLALAPDGTRHLLVPVRVVAPLPTRPTRGLDIAVEELLVADEPSGAFIRLSPNATVPQTTFLAVATDVIEAVGGSSDPAQAVASTLERWRWFWGVDPSGLDRDAALGLFGELWFLDRWLDLHDGLDHWTGPSGTRHDFQWDAVSVEVKASAVRSDGSAVHRIHTLEQLEDPESGQLHLFSLQVRPDALSSNTLPVAVERLVRQLEDDDGRMRLLLQRLADSGYSPADADRHGQPWRVVDETLYEVRAGFPRLTRTSWAGGPPNGIERISYALNLAACRDFAIAASPSQAAPLLRRSAETSTPGAPG